MSTFALPQRLFVRPVSARYDACVRSDARAAIDVARARAQHAAYVATIAALGVEIVEAPADDASPDACFIEDTAVITGRHALVTRPGAPSRRGEVDAVAALLASSLEVHRVEEPATIDGGDVLRVDDVLFVGASARTSDAGIERLREVAKLDGLRVERVAVPAGLHFKSGATLADARTLLYASALLDKAALAALLSIGLRCLEAPEVEGANVLALGPHVVVSAAAPKTAALLRARGLEVHTVALDEIHKGDGALTCLSLRVPALPSWST